MSAWTISDDYMRSEVLSTLRRYKADEMLRAKVSDTAEEKAYRLRQAAHYQQAINLLTAAEMPARERRGTWRITVEFTPEKE